MPTWLSGAFPSLFFFKLLLVQTPGGCSHMEFCRGLLLKGMWHFDVSNFVLTGSDAGVRLRVGCQNMYACRGGLAWGFGSEGQVPAKQAPPCCILHLLAQGSASPAPASWGFSLCLCFSVSLRFPGWEADSFSLVSYGQSWPASLCSPQPPWQEGRAVGPVRTRKWQSGQERGPSSF